MAPSPIPQGREREVAKEADGTIARLGGIIKIRPLIYIKAGMRADI